MTKKTDFIARQVDELREAAKALPPGSLASILAGSPLARFLDTPPSAEQVRAAEAMAQREQAEALASRLALLKDIGIPEKHARIIASGTHDRTFAVKCAGRWLAGDRLVLVLVGPHDAGKTFACGLALSFAADRWVASVERGPAPRMVATEHLHKAWMRRDGEGPEATTRANPDILLRCPLLVIDDLGQEPAGIAHITMEALDTIIRTRCDAGLRTMVTSNLVDMDALLEHVKIRSQRDQRVGERLTEYSRWRACPFEGYRRRAGSDEGRAT